MLKNFDIEYWTLKHFREFPWVYCMYLQHLHSYHSKPMSNNDCSPKGSGHYIGWYFEGGITLPYWFTVLAVVIYLQFLVPAHIEELHNKKYWHVLVYLSTQHKSIWCHFKSSFQFLVFAFLFCRAIKLEPWTTVSCSSFLAPSWDLIFQSQGHFLCTHQRHERDIDDIYVITSRRNLIVILFF